MSPRIFNLGLASRRPETKKKATFWWNRIHGNVERRFKFHQYIPWVRSRQFEVSEQMRREESKEESRRVRKVPFLFFTHAERERARWESRFFSPPRPTTSEITLGEQARVSHAADRQTHPLLLVFLSPSYLVSRHLPGPFSSVRRRIFSTTSNEHIVADETHSWLPRGLSKLPRHPPGRSPQFRSCRWFPS